MAWHRMSVLLLALGCEVDNFVEPEGVPGGQVRERTLAPVDVRLRPQALVKLSPAELELLVRKQPEELGSVSYGKPTRGGLFNGEQLEPSGLLVPRSPQNAWGTAETLRSLERAVEMVHLQFPDTAPLYVGDISKRRGGYLRPHRSHQSGRDVDLGFYYVGVPRWYVKATEKNLDFPRTWALIKALLSETDVEYIFLDRSVQAWLRRYAEETEAPSWLDSVFESPANPLGIIRHTRGHDDHLHVRFHDVVAEEAARHAYAVLARLGRL